MPDNVVLLYLEQHILQELIHPIKQNLVSLYKENSLGPGTFSGWMPSTVLWEAVDPITQAAYVDLCKALATVLFTPEPTAAASNQPWMVPLAQIFMCTKDATTISPLRDCTHSYGTQQE